MRDDAWLEGGFLLHRCAAFRYRSTSRFAVWHMEDAFDALVEVVPSEWVAELESLYSSAIPSKPLHHYMIFVHDGGCFEFAAADWSWLPETPAP
jgi:hypothetical protein